MAKRWTSSEIAVVEDCVRRNPGNLQEAFETASRQLVDRSFSAVEFKWYSHIKYGDTIFFVRSKAVTLPPNVKNILRTHGKKGKTRV